MKFFFVNCKYEQCISYYEYIIVCAVWSMTYVG